MEVSLWSVARWGDETVHGQEWNGKGRRGLAEQHQRQDGVGEHHAARPSAAAQGRRNRIGTPPPRGGGVLDQNEIFVCFMSLTS